MDVDHLIQYLDTDLSMATLREMDRIDLYGLRKLLHHWHELADRTYRERRAMSIEEESE